MSKKLFFLSLLFSLNISFFAQAQTTIPGDSLVYGPMFSPVYNNSVRAWVLTKNTGSGDVLSLSLTGAGSPATELSGQVYNSDDRLGYSLRSYEYTGLTPGETYSAKLLVNATPSPRIATITNEKEIIDDFEFLSGGCGRIYDLTRCIDIPESQFHVNGSPEMFNVMATEGSDLMVWLGDAVYLLGLEHAMGQCLDGVDDWANKDMAFDRYRFQRDYHDSLTVAMPQLAITDNHDLGPNEFNKNMPTIAETREVFMEWWPNPEYNSTSEGQGLYSSYVYKDVEYFLTDNRSFRDGTADHFGAEQFDWLKQGLLNSTATFKVIINATPTFTPIGGRNFSVSNQAVEFFNFIQDNNINGVLSLSADIHEQKFMVRDGDTKYPLYDILSGNLNSDIGNGNYNINYDSNNIIQGVKQTYLRINVYGDVDDRRMKVEYVDEVGQPYFEEIIHEDMLTSQNADAYKLGLSISNNVVDTSGYTHPINASNYTFTTNRNDEANEAMVFGTNTSVEIPATNALNFHNRPFSLTFWVNPTELPENGATILSNGENGVGISFGISSEGHLTYTDHALGTTYESNYSVLKNSWSYITWKYDNVKRKLALYYNGFLIQNWTNVVSPIESASDLKIGNNFEGKQFIGSLDELSLYGRLISDEDVLLEADIQTNRGGVLKVANSQMVIPGNVINPVLSDDFTIEFWGKLNADPGTNYKILSSNGRVDGNSTGLSFEFPDSNKLNVVFGVNGSGWNTITDQGEAWNIGEWNHIALVVSNTNGTIAYYQNGNLIANGTYGGYISNSWGLGLGYSPSYGSPIQGELDDIRIWQRTLTADEIIAHMNYPLVGDETDLAVYYDFTPVTETDTSVISEGSVNYDMDLDGGELVTATSPIGNIALDYQENVSGKWNKNNNLSNNGLTFPDAITAYNSNIVVGNKTNTAIEAVSGLDDMFHANGGWKIDPLNSPFATVKINLEESLKTEAEAVINSAGKYYFLKQDEITNTFSVVTDGSFDGSNVTFYNANLEEGNYFLAWEEAVFVPGRGGALTLSDAHDITIPHTAVETILGGAHTVEFWVNLTEAPAGNDKTLISNHGRVDGNSTGFTLEVGSNNSIDVAYGENGSGWTKVNSQESLQLGEWNHIAVTSTPGGELKIYLNGELKQSTNFNSYVPNGTWDFKFGTSQNYGGDFNYMIDEFRMWETERTQEEIVAQMHNTITSGTDLVFDYTFDQDDDGTLINSGSNTDVVNYTNAQIIGTTSPVSEVNQDFSDIITGNWSITNETIGGLYISNSIASFTENMVVGHNTSNETLPLGTLEETYYVAGGWYLNALNMEAASVEVALSSVFDNVEYINSTVAQYMLIKGDPTTSYEVVSAATETNGVVTFTDVTLDLGNYFLAFEVDVATAIGNQGGAIDLAGGHQVHIPSSTMESIMSGDFTIELWVNLTEDPGSNVPVLSNHGRINGNSTGFSLEFPDNNSVNAVFGTNGSGWNKAESIDPLLIGEWNHIAVTASPGAEIKLYVNGELKATNAFDAYVPNNTWDFALGETINYNGQSYSVVDELRVWSEVRTQDEIKSEMHKTFKGTNANLEFNYTFNQDDSGTLVNSGSSLVEVDYTNASIIPATTPVRIAESPFDDHITGNWSVKNDNTNGLYISETITDHNTNVVIGKEATGTIEHVLGQQENNTLYLNSRWKFDPLFLENGTPKVDLTKIFDNLNDIRLIASEYFLLTGDPSTALNVIATGTKDSNIVTFSQIPLEETVVYLAWKNVPEYQNGMFPIASQGLWKFNDTGVDLGTDWKNNAYDDSAWSFGNAILGYGDGVESTTLDYGTDSDNKYPTYYLRHTFDVDDASKYGDLLFKVLKDDGVVVYVNGTEAFRMNMPNGEITYNTYASSAIGGSDEEVWNEISTANLLQDGENVIAVELHQAGGDSSDLRFDMQVNYQLPAITETDFPLLKDQEWYYFDEGTSLDAETWQDIAYDNLDWGRGFAPFGYGDTVNTEISYGPDSGNKYITSYFVKDINVDVSTLTNMVAFGLRRDDGAVVYVNGVEVFRMNMPDGTIDYLTQAPNAIGGIDENIYYIKEVPSTVFVDGVNRIAVEIHQQSGTSSDLRFDMYIKNIDDLEVDCAAPHIGCFTSIEPTGQTNNLIISDEHQFQLIFKEGDAYTIGSGNVPGNNDYTAYVPTSGSSELGHLSVNHENTPGGVSIVDLHLDTTTNLWVIDDSQAVDLYNNTLVTTTRNCSGGTTSWGTVVTAEESTNSGDVNNDGYQDVGWLVEIDPVTAQVMDYGSGQEKLWAMGRMNHENVVISADQTTAYYGEDGGTHCVYKYVMDTPGNLSAGTVYVLKLDLGLSGNDPSSSTAQWVEVPNDTQSDRNNLNTVAAALGGTSFNGVEDCDINPYDGKIYFAAKGRNRIYRFKDNGTTVSEFETFVGGKSYDLTTKNGTVSEPWSDGNDNLVFDDKGNLWVCEDGGNNYIWVVRPGHTQSNPDVLLFASMPSGSEPTGLTFTPDYKYGFFSVQHPSGSNAPQEDATENDVTFNASSTVVFSLEENLGTLGLDPVTMIENGISLYPNPTNGLVTLLLSKQQAGEDVSVKVYDLLGRDLLQFNGMETTGGGQQQVPLDVSSVVQGNHMLLLQVKVGNKTQQFKVLTKN